MSYSIDNERFHLRLDDVNYIYESVKNVIISDIKFFFHVYNYKILFKMKYDMTCSINFKRLNRRANVRVLFNLFVKFWMILNSWEINHFICNDLILYIHACFWWLAAVSNISSFVIGQCSSSINSSIEINILAKKKFAWNYLSKIISYFQNITIILR